MVGNAHEAWAGPKWDYCSPRLVSDKASDMHSLRSKLENSYNPNYLCLNLVDFKDLKKFDSKDEATYTIVLEKPLQIKNITDKTEDANGYLFVLDGNLGQGYKVILDGSKLDPEEAAMTVAGGKGKILVKNFVLKNLPGKRIEGSATIPSIEEGATAKDDFELELEGIEVEGDKDLDRVPDTIDNCPEHANLDQEDADTDAKGDVCDETPQGEPSPSPSPSASPIASPSPSPSPVVSSSPEPSSSPPAPSASPVATPSGEPETQPSGTPSPTPAPSGSPVPSGSPAPTPTAPPPSPTPTPIFDIACEGDADCDGVADAQDNCPTLANADQNAEVCKPATSESPTVNQPPAATIGTSVHDEGTDCLFSLSATPHLGSWLWGIPVLLGLILRRKGSL